MNGRFPIALHIMTLLCKADSLLSSRYMAGSINADPVLVRKELNELIKGGLVRSREGKNGGYGLKRKADDISIAEVYQLVRQDALLGKARNTPNPDCPVGKQINAHLNELYREVDEALLKRLQGISLRSFCDKFDQSQGDKIIQKPNI